MEILVSEPMAVFRHSPLQSTTDQAVASGVAFSMDGAHCVSACGDRTLRLYDVRTILHRSSYELAATGCQSVAFTHASSVVAVTPSHAWDARLYLFDLAAGQYLSEYGPWAQDQQRASGESLSIPVAMSTALSTSPREDLFAAASKDGTAALITPTISRPVCIFRPPKGDGPPAGRQRFIHWGGAHPSCRTSFSPDGLQLCVSRSNTAQVFDLRITHAPLYTLNFRDVFTDSNDHFSSVQLCAGDVALATCSRGPSAMVRVGDTAAPPVPLRSFGLTANVDHFFAPEAHSELPHPLSCGAVVCDPTDPMGSAVVQPATRRSQTATGSYPLLVYDTSTPPNQGSDGTMGTEGALSHAFLPRDVGPVRAVAAHPRLRIMATASTTLHWWTLEKRPLKE